MRVEFLILPNGKKPAEEFLKELDNKTVAKVYKLIERLEVEGRLAFPHARKLEGYKNLWELRINSPRGATRVFYFYWKQDTIVLASGFVKKTQKTPLRELEKVTNYLKQTGVFL